MRQLAGTKTRYRRAHAAPLAGLISDDAEYNCNRPFQKCTARMGNAVKDFSLQDTGSMKGIAGRIDPAFEPRMWRQVVATGVSPWLEKHR